MAMIGQIGRAEGGPLPGSGGHGLLERLRAGEQAAFEELVRSQGGRLLAAARRILRDEDDAQDAVQEAFLGAFRALPSFEGQASLSTWLYRIAINAALMKLRGRRRRREEPIEPLLPSFQPDGHMAIPARAWTVGADEALERRELAGLVRACIDRLPESHRIVLLLRDVEGLDNAEAARLVGIRPEALKMRLHRARQALRTLLEPHLATPESVGSYAPSKRRRAARIDSTRPAGISGSRSTGSAKLRETSHTVSM